MEKRVGRFVARFLMVVMTFIVIFLGGMATSSFAGDNDIVSEGMFVDTVVANSVSGINSASIVVMIVVVLILGIIGALLLDSKKTLEKF